MLYDWISQLKFQYPWVFAALLLLPLFAWLYLRKEKKRSPFLVVSTVRSFREKSWKQRLTWLLPALRMLAIACIIAALARPQVRFEQRRSEGEGIDIVLCMDASGSMGSRDISPSRMEAAKEVAAEFVRSRPVDRIGLVVFAGESFTLCPLTGDRNMLLTQIEQIDIRQYDNMRGTVIGEGLAKAVERLQKSDSKSKVVILLTDGKEDPPETRIIDPLTAIEIARAKSVKVYTIGISGEVAPAAGVSKGASNPAADFLDEALLTNIATSTGGQFFRAKDKDGLSKIYRQIDRLEKSKVETFYSSRSEERYFPFLLAALIAVFLEQALRFTVFRRFP